MASSKYTASVLSTITNFDLNKANCTQLKQFLRQHGLPVSGCKQELQERVRGCVELGKKPLQTLRVEDETFNSARSKDRLLTPLGETLPEVGTLNSGWTSDISVFPPFSNSALYNYLVLNSQRTHDGKPIGAKRQLKAKVFYKDRHVHSVEFNEINKTLSHGYVRARVIPSIPTKKENKPNDYYVWVCLAKVSGNVHAAGCNCEAGAGEACNHVAALLYCLVDVTEKKVEGLHSVTSNGCLWLKPRERKLSPKKANQLIFKKQKCDVSRSTACDKGQTPLVHTTKVNLNRFGSKLQNINPYAAFLLCHEETVDMYSKPIHRQNNPSLSLPEPQFMYRDGVDLESCSSEFRSYMEKLTVTESQVRFIEEKTRKQEKSDLWFLARKDRITASRFGQIFKRQKSTKAESCLKSLMGYTSFSSESVKWGSSHEPAARRCYIREMKPSHEGINVKECGFFTSTKYPFLGATPDGIVVCPHCQDEGLLEIKCPYTYRNVSPQEAAKQKDFCCELINGELTLKKTHNYYYQVQGQLALTGKKWCDFYVWTLSGSHMERIHFNSDVWKEVEVRLREFFVEHMVPEIFTRRVKRGQSLY